MRCPYRLTRTTYRGVPGWLISGGLSLFGVSIFFEHETAARRTIAKMREDADYQIITADFEPERVKP